MQIKNLELVEKMKKGGFTDKEALIYVSVLELGGAYPSKVAAYSGLNRTTAYHILATLAIKGLVGEIERKNKFFYQAEKPEKILGFARRQISLAEEKLDLVKTILPDIEGLFGANGERPKVTYHEGVDGLLSIYEDMLNQNKPYEMLSFSRADELEGFIPKKFFKNFIEEKAKQGITTRGIIPDTPENRKYSERLFAHVPKKFWPERKYIPKEKFLYSGEITIYGDSKISIVNFEKNALTGVVIEDKALHSAMQTIFELSWHSTLVSE